jgi:neuropeptide F receptor
MSFDISSFILQYIIPAAVITYSYFEVWLALSKRARPSQCVEKEKLELKRKRKTNYMLIAMVAIFAICWMPLNIIHLIISLQNEKIIITKSMFTIAHLVAMSSTIYNPFLYGWLNENFRKEFHRVLPCFFRTSTRLKSQYSLKSAKSTHKETVKSDDNDKKGLASKFITIVQSGLAENEVEEIEENEKFMKETCSDLDDCKVEKCVGIRVTVL